MSFDVNNNFLSTSLGSDRKGFTTPDCDASEPIQPYLPYSYPAPWLPSKRRDDAHPAGLNITISHANIVGVDKNGYLIPAGYFSGTQATKANGGKFCVIEYSADDLALGTLNPVTGVNVATATECALIAAPSDADVTHGETVTLADGVTTKVFTADQVAAALLCTLIPGGVCRGLGYALRNMWQNLFIPDVTDVTGGANYAINTNNPTKLRITNYQPEPGNAIRTTFVLRMPWIGATPNTLAALATTDGITGYSLPAFNKSFTHFTGVLGNAEGQLFQGARVVPSTLPGDAGNYMPYDPAKHNPGQIVGHVMGIQQAYPVKDFANRVRTQFERGQQFKGAFSERNPTQMLMGGSATRGMTYQVSMGTNGLFRNYIDQGKAALLGDAAHAPIYTTVLVMITLS